METKQLEALSIIITGLIFGFIGKFLFMGFGLGLNISTYILLLLVSMIFYRYTFQKPLSQYQKLLTGFSLFFAIFIGVYSSKALLFFNSLGIFIACIMGLSITNSLSQYTLRISTFLKNTFKIFWLPIIAFIDLSRNIILPSRHIIRGQYTKSIISGLFWAAPLLFVFGNLLASSDARFKQFTIDLFSFNFQNISASFISVTCWSLFSTTFLFHSILNNSSNNKNSSHNNDSNFYAAEGIQLITILGCINLLFSSYIAVQFTYFFGGDSLVLNTSGVTYSSYANKGFWDLVFVAMLALPVLYIINFLPRNEPKNIQRWINLLSLFTLCAIAIMELSAAHRMYIYVREYNLTEYRFYSTWFMCFIVSELLLFAMTVSRGKREYFISSTCIASLIFIGLLNLINPDAYIAKSNLSRFLERRSIDYNYLQSLSYDAYPAIASFFERHPTQDTCQFLQYKYTRNLTMHKISTLKNIDKQPWQELSISTYNAHTAMKPIMSNSICNL